MPLCPKCGLIVSDNPQVDKNSIVFYQFCKCENLKVNQQNIISSDSDSRIIIPEFVVKKL